ncbi:MAG: CPBP family intramembrane metalloprotease [Lachnospiraceae bacterium]|nr:CPBP family intramembrane metalloprotease [Lachnospiraceae bacterium]
METSIVMKKTYSKYALAAALFLVAATIVQLFNGLVLSNLLPDHITQSGAFSFLNIIIPEYFIGFPILFLIVSKMEKNPPEKKAFGFGRSIVSFLMCTGAMGIGMVVGTLLNFALTLPFGVDAGDTNTLANLMQGSDPFWRILTVGILAPIVEECVFRKFLIDRTVKYGEWVAILTSSLMFGLFHGNFSQFFYATLLGGIFAYVYIRTGKIWITILFHMIINLATSVVTVTLLGNVDFDKITELQEMSLKVTANPADTALQNEYVQLLSEAGSVLALYAWFGLLGILALAGIITWIIVLAGKRIHICRTEAQVDKGMKYAWKNRGMLVFLVVTIALFVVNYLSMIIPAMK